MDTQSTEVLVTVLIIRQAKRLPNIQKQYKQNLITVLKNFSLIKCHLLLKKNIPRRYSTKYPWDIWSTIRAEIWSIIRADIWSIIRADILWIIRADTWSIIRADIWSIISADIWLIIRVDIWLIIRADIW